MKDYVLKIRKENLFYMSCYLKADNRTQAIEQANEIMNRFPDSTENKMIFTAELIEKDKDQFQGQVFSWFN